MLRQPLDILIFVEHVARELDIACALKYLIESQYGLRVEVASCVYDREKCVQDWQPNVVATTVSFDGINSPLYAPIYSAYPETVYVDLAYEQIYHKFNKEYRGLHDAFPKEHVLHHAWGDFHAEFLQSQGVAAENIFINGNPCYTLYRPPYCAYYESRIEMAERHGLDPEKRWIFIPENYKTAFLPERYLEAYIQGGANRKEAYQYRDFDVASVREVVQWWVQAARQGTVELIVRPRPNIPTEHITTACLDIAGGIPPSLHIIKDGTVREWILASDVVMSSISTSLIEAAVAGKPIYMLMPIPLLKFLHLEWHGLVQKLENLSAFLEVANKAVLPPNWKSLQAWAEREMMSQGDAIANLANFLAKVCRRERPVPKPLDKSLLLSINSQPQDATNKPQNQAKVSLHQRLAGRIWRSWKQATRRTTHSEVKPKLKFNPHGMDRFSQDHVANRTQRWASVFKQNANGSVPAEFRCQPCSEGGIYK